MLLNAASQLITAGNGASSDAVGDLVRPAPVPVPPKSGRALLAVLEQQAQRELAGMLATAPAAAPLEPALAGLAWDLGLSGDEVD
ncbi:hypothetical protein J7J08_07290 [Stenotrophomonas sp. ISL-67]|uniref:hypothetical protein n=1 Tax=Stenotrophomonas sp. ISL-67 TaxID=2819171 RepID=UPI001BE940A1|nr:hypothetical protein [Stenotrophomonas sp. ISL-67]MBT2767440.1 hypothetical protein [Stenotrophomonas sp. ISL-67]